MKYKKHWHLHNIFRSQQYSKCSKNLASVKTKKKRIFWKMSKYRNNVFMILNPDFSLFFPVITGTVYCWKCRFPTIFFPKISKYHTENQHFPCTGKYYASHPLYSHMIIIKSKTRNRLSQSSLNAVLRICMFSMPLAKFSQTYVEDCVTYWCNAKECRLGQRKRKRYSKRKLTLKKHKTFDIIELLSENSSESSESDSVSSETDHELWQLYKFLELFWTILRTKETVWVY